MSRVSRLESEGQYALPGLELHPALVHVMTPEFQQIDPADFADIPDAYVAYTHPDALRSSLIGVKDPKGNGGSVIKYQPYNSNEWLGIGVTPEEFGLFARHIPMLAKAAFNGVLAERDKKLQEETNNPDARARTDEDIATARRGAMRQVLSKATKMQTYYETELEPRIELIEQFKEMTQHKTLARGTYQSVSKRVERLRVDVFGDMLDVVGNNRDWNEDKANLAYRSLQKRLYLDPIEPRRIDSLKGLLQLADDYYGHKRALVLGRIAEANRYRRQNHEVYEDILATDEARKNGNV